LRTGVVFTGTFTGTGAMPARSPMMFTSSPLAGTMILAFCQNAFSTVSSLRSTWALPTKYCSAASLTSLMARASPSAARILACLMPSAFLISARRWPSACVSVAVA